MIPQPLPTVVVHELLETRQILFEQLDRPAMRPLPPSRYEFATWTTPKVNIDYHCDVGRHYYSVPYQLVGHRLDARVSEYAVELCGYSTQAGHMPERHQAHLAWSPERLIAWAARTGPATAELVQAIMASRPHPELASIGPISVVTVFDRLPLRELPLPRPATS